ncbi:hypothetical protein, partial [Bacteroides xylanisolvens]|uniref:hypothetical protein n=1 Tax=Bacteroides xylanisolvens TaxID=371601 RepID=UPI001AA11245
KKGKTDVTNGNTNNKMRDSDRSKAISGFTGIAYTEANIPAEVSISIQMISKAAATIYIFST